MSPDRYPRSRRAATLAAIGLVVVGGLVLFRVSRGSAPGDTRNYKLTYKQPVGWFEQPHVPILQFQLRQKATGVRIVGGTQRTESDVNPDPESTTATFADDYIASTRSAMPSWTAERLPNYSANGVEFALVHRGSPDHQMISACCVHGNTTVLISMAGDGAQAAKIMPGVNDFKAFLSTVQLTPTTNRD